MRTIRRNPRLKFPAGRAGGLGKTPMQAHVDGCRCVSCVTAEKSARQNSGVTDIEAMIAEAIRVELARQRGDDVPLDADDPAMFTNARPVYTNERAYVPPKVLLGGKRQMSALTPAERAALSGNSGRFTDEEAYVPPAVLLARRSGDDEPLRPPSTLLDRRRGRGRDAA